ncbi:MAG TPA: NEW3 domain-containing protein, partial [Ilumatobacteraceae bacterium]|nr:NEW3 domain-containing protein [Ilumatobacteraceae bacterium]
MRAQVPRSLIRRAGKAAALTAGVVAVAALGAAAPAHADATLVVTTPYPSIEAQPGSDVKLSLAVTSAAPDVVNLDVGGLPDGWTATLRGGGFVIHSITSQPDTGATADLEIAVPPDASPGEYPITVTGQDASGGRSEADMTVVVADVVNNGISLTADFPSLSGDPGTAFTYNLKVTNDTPIEQTFTFDPTAPQGWDVTASPTAEAKAQTVTIDAGSTGGVKVTATPPATADQGSYDVDVT